MQSLVNPATIGPIVFFVGLQINEEALNFMPARHYSAYIIGLFPSVYDWVTNIANRAPLASDDLSYDINAPGSSQWVGVLSWKRGALLVSLLWVSMIVNVLDRQWINASIWAFVASLFAVVGICTASGCWDFAEQWMFFVAYLMLMATFLIIFIASRFDKEIEDPIDDETRHAFDDWFANAYKYKDENGNILDSRDTTITTDASVADEMTKDLEHDPVVDEKEKAEPTPESVSDET
jgi:hypothetical protein